MLMFLLLSSVFVSSAFEFDCPGDKKKIAQGLSDADKKAVLDSHFNLRLSITKGVVCGQPRGKNLNNLEYDAVLAKKAEVVSNACIDDHIKIIDDRFPEGVGQSLYMSYTSMKEDPPIQHWLEATKSWFDERKNFKYPTNVTSGMMAGHYKQMVWGLTKKLGCDFVYYFWNGKYYKMYTCNYGPAGNMFGLAPYERNTTIVAIQCEF